MNLLKTILEAQNGGAVRELSRQFNLDDAQAGAAVGKLLPALTAGLKRNMATPQGLDGLLGALKNGGHERYLEDPSALTRDEAINDGNGILGHIFGSKDVSRQVASRAAEQTGIDVSVLKKMLPMVAAMTMGSMKKQTAEAGVLGAAGGASMPQAAPAAGGAAGAAGMLSKMLDADGDGSITDDLFGIAKKFF